MPPSSSERWHKLLSSLLFLMHKGQKNYEIKNYKRKKMLIYLAKKKMKNMENWENSLHFSNVNISILSIFPPSSSLKLSKTKNWMKSENLSNKS